MGWTSNSTSTSFYAPQPKMRVFFWPNRPSKSQAVKPFPFPRSTIFDLEKRFASPTVDYGGRGGGGRGRDGVHRRRLWETDPLPASTRQAPPLPDFVVQISIAEWNPEKDLLAMVTDDSKVVLHRFNWQRLWMISPGKCITSLCWRPDGKVIALGIEDGSILLHDVESVTKALYLNGKLLRSIKSHSVAVIYLNWEEDSHAAMCWVALALPHLALTKTRTLALERAAKEACKEIVRAMTSSVVREREESQTVDVVLIGGFFILVKVSEAFGWCAFGRGASWLVPHGLEGLGRKGRREGVDKGGLSLVWESFKEDVDNAFVYEDRTSRFFPPAPRIPRMPGLGAGDAGLMDDYEDTFHEFSTSPGQHFNVLSSGDKDGSICFSIFGIFPIGKINIHQLPIRATLPNRIATLQILNASIQKLALSKNLSQLIVLCFGELVEDFVESKSKSIQRVEHFELQSSSVNRVSSVGLHCFVLKTSIFLDSVEDGHPLILVPCLRDIAIVCRKNELHQVAQQASSIEDLVEVVRASLSVMSKHWSEAMHSFHEKFDPLSSLIVDHGLFSTPQDEFLSVLFGARTSPPLHQFLANTLGEAGLKRVSKAVDCAGKELHSVIHEHLQPAVEIIGFRIAELRGLSRWRARYRVIGLDEKLIDNATKKAGMLLVQVERFSRILVIVLHLLQNFFNWVLRSIKILMSEPIDQVQSANSELIVVFLKFVLNHDPVGELMDATKTIDVDGEIMERLEELVIFGGYADTKYLERNLLNEFNQMEQCFKEAFLHQFTTVSQKIHCEGLMPLYEFRYSTQFSSPAAPTSIVYYKGNYGSESTNLNNLIDYTCFKVPNESLELTNCIGIMRGFTNAVNPLQKQTHCPEAVLLRVPEAFHCVDLSFYKENQLILLLNEATSTSDSAMRSLIMMVQLDDLCFLPLSREVPEIWAIHCLKASAVDMHLENGKVRYVPDPVSRPLAVSGKDPHLTFQLLLSNASRGLACVFTSRSHAMVYILDEDEDEDEASGA
ncbi:hypothetical protein ZIOFF_021393 [Zingiber officinale]|uniref:Anaphase-promoting complex subunit 4 n=1 Tax=Zingiber officinale TaxID=94328 RepID=A0A8J5H1E5_ZINOF|nr:hypothetical protein ZIOFF_021393 [Zingiber officinale]